MTQPQTSMANAIRALAMDAVQQAVSGHPGAPMGMADMAVALWADHMKHDPLDPQWINRDRFVLSNGHASMLLYAVLHLTGYDLPMSQIKQFRKLHSLTPGHPEVHLTPGVETTTGPLGQGLANAVGMALAEKLLAQEFNRHTHNVIDHHTYVFMGDGCLMEGVSHEACSLAGAWKLNKLIALYDDNGISIDGAVAPWFADHTAERFKAYGWQVIGPIDGHDAQAVSQAIETAKHANSNSGPTLIVCRTHIGKGSPNRANTSKAHGEPLGADEITLTRNAIDWHHPPFEIPESIYALWDAKAKGQSVHEEWNQRFAAYQSAHPQLAKELLRRLKGDLPEDFEEQIQNLLKQFESNAANVASRAASQLSLNALTQTLTELLGGSADLTGSNLTQTPSTPSLRVGANGSFELPNAIPSAHHINYGVREFGMAAIMNGVALHSGFIPYGGTFLTFSDYSRNAIRMAALMKQRVIHVFTHDSIGLGEDGPTHQSIEHTQSLRLIPGLHVWRPCDTSETLVAWHCALKSHNAPSALLLSRQALPHAPKANTALIEKGAYVLSEPSEVGIKKRAQIVLIATGSEVSLALKAQTLLASLGIGARVVSMPCTSYFDAQSVEYKKSVLPPGTPRVAIEMGSTSGWWKYGVNAVVGIDSYGESAPAPALFEHFGFTAENVAQTAQVVLHNHHS
jgi:transketolase